MKRSKPYLWVGGLVFFYAYLAFTGKGLCQSLPQVEFVISEDRGTEASPKVIEIQLSEPWLTEVQVEYKISGGTAVRGEDFVLDDGWLTFSPGETKKSIMIQPIDDEVKEEDETVLITLSNPINAVLGAKKTFTYTLFDDDTVTVSFDAPISSNFESVSPAVLEVALSRAAQETIAVHYTVSGTAIGNGVDYTLPEGTLTFAPGETKKKIIIDITDDALLEPDKTVAVTLVFPENSEARLGKFSSHTYWILDDDGPPENIVLFKQEVEAFEPGKKLVIIGPKTLTVNPRGMVLDKYGNIYISDQGPNRGEDEGSILMWPKGRQRVLRIITGLTRPGDVELSPDQKTLIVAGPKGDVYRIPLGLSLRLANIDPLSGNTRVHLFSQATGEMVAKVSPDGYFHFTGLLLPNQQGEIYADVEHAGKTKRFQLRLGQPGETGEPYGHAVLDLNF